MPTLPLVVWLSCLPKIFGGNPEAHWGRVVGSKASKRVESQFEEKRSFIMGHDKMRCFLYLQATFILLGG